jgi:hypothetical protein
VQGKNTEKFDTGLERGQDARMETEISPERWLPVVGFEGLYSVSDAGRVRSEERICYGGDHAVHARILAPILGADGYLSVQLRRDGKTVACKVHRLVLSAFVGQRPSTTDSRHADRRPTNNRLENLSWGSRSENMADAVKHRTTNRGERGPMSKLTNEQAAEIRASPVIARMLANKYGLSRRSVSRIKNGESYRPWETDNK